MKEDLDFHDRELIALFCNPGTNTMQIYISYRPGKILKIYIRDIVKLILFGSLFNIWGHSLMVKH